MDSGRLVAVLLLVMLMTETGVQLVCQLLPSGWELPAPPRPATPPQPGQDKQQTLNTITGHCLPKLVCQLHALPNTDSLSDSERNLISMIG